MFYFQSTIQDLFNIDIAENDASRRMAEVLDRDNERERRRQKDDVQVCFSFHTSLCFASSACHISVMPAVYTVSVHQ
jgi:hypothetical protein